MNYNQFYLTLDGRDLLNRTTTGDRLKFTRVALGTGNVESVNDLRGLKKLVEEKLSTAINGIVDNQDGTCTIKAAFTNKEVLKGFYINEIGVYAEDPLKGEILYFVAATGGEGDFMPAFKKGNVDVSEQDARNSGKLVEQEFEIIVAIGDVAEVIVNFDDSMVFVTKSEFDRLAGIGWTTENVKELWDNMRLLKLEFAAFKGSTVEGMGKNAFYVAFSHMTDEEEYKGIWDKDLMRLRLSPVGGEA